MEEFLWTTPSFNNYTSQFLNEGVVNGRISMKFEGGIFDKIGAGLFLREN